MIQSSLLPSLFSAALHGGVVMAVAWGTWMEDIPQPPASQTIRVVFEEPPSQKESSSERTQVKKLPMHCPKYPPSASPKAPSVKQKTKELGIEKILVEDTLPSSSISREAQYRGDNLHNPLPNYPLVARKRGHEGQVCLRVCVSQTGEVAQVVVTQSSTWSELDEVALETVKGWKFRPVLHKGKPIPDQQQISFTFELKTGQVRQ